MLTLSYPWLLVFLILPLFIKRWFPSYRESRQALRTTWFKRIAQLLDQEPAEGSVLRQRSGLAGAISWICWFLIILAVARPQLIEPPVERVIPTRDVLLVVDLSGSMETEDFIDSEGGQIDRLTAVKEVLDDFLTRRKGDRVGLIVFGNAPFVQVPFTQDLEVCRLLLAETAVRMAGPRTAFGDAIGLGITLFERSEVEDRLMIALTDGNDTGSRVPPVEAAKIARDNDITIHVVGIGDPTAAGEEKLDEEALKLVAQNSGGRYYYGADREQVAEIYNELDRIDSREVETQSYTPKIDLFHLPLALFFLLQLGYYCLLLVFNHVTQRRAENA